VNFIKDVSLVFSLSAQSLCLALLIGVPRSLAAQTPPSTPTTRSPTKTYQPPPRKPAKTDEDVRQNEALKVQRRAFAVSTIMSLSDEARSYNDVALRAHVLACAADALWDTDPDAARTLFRRAWEAAEKADKADVVEQSSDNHGPLMLTVLRTDGVGDSRSEVLKLAATRDRRLGEELLAKLIDAAVRPAETSKVQILNDSWTTTEEVSKRLQVAHRFLDYHETEKSFEFAATALEQVNDHAINFLCRLRLMNAALADKQFMRLLEHAEMDPTADANTVSGLSSYAFTPGLYVTFLSDGGVRWTPTFGTISAPDLPPEIKARFFRVAAGILLRPTPPPDQDLTSAGLIGKYMVIKRLLPLFEHYAPETAVALQSQLIGLAEQQTKNVVEEDDFLLRQGIIQEADPRDLFDRLQERVNHAKNDRERDEIYADTAAILATQGNTSAQDIADKISNLYWREMARRYVDISLICNAVSKNNIAAALRFAKADSLTHEHRAWAYQQIARLVMDLDRTRASGLLEEALAETRRMDSDETSRVSLMIGIARQFLAADDVRPWEVIAEAIKAANAAEGFSGEATGLSAALITSNGLKLIDLDASAFDLAALVRLLAKQDFVRANDLAKSFKYDAPRAVATLAVSSAALEETKRAK
jgi:hypothetical protein